MLRGCGLTDNTVSTGAPLGTTSDYTTNHLLTSLASQVILFWPDDDMLVTRQVTAKQLCSLYASDRIQETSSRAIAGGLRPIVTPVDKEVFTDMYVSVETLPLLPRINHVYQHSVCLTRWCATKYAPAPPWMW